MFRTSYHSSKKKSGLIIEALICLYTEAGCRWGGRGRMYCARGREDMSTNNYGKIVILGKTVLEIIVRLMILGLIRIK